MANQTLRAYGKLTYERCRELVAATRNKTSKKLGGNTEISLASSAYTATRERVEGEIYVVYFYATPLLTYLPDGRVIIDTRGHRSVTTKERINSLSPISVYQHKGTWHVSKHDTPHGKHAERFFDGYTVGDTSEGYALLYASMQGDEVARLAYEDYKQEKGILA